MSCGNAQNFSEQQNTWSRKSNLSMNNWDPYPSNQDPKNRYGNKIEKYCPCAQAIYSMGQNCLDSAASYAPLQQYAVFKDVKTRENYCGSYKNPVNYINLDFTWSAQKPYSL